MAFSIIELAFCQLPAIIHQPHLPHLTSTQANLCLLGSLGVYFGLTYLFHRWSQRWSNAHNYSFHWMAALLVLLILSGVTFTHRLWVYPVAILFLQHIFLFIVVTRRNNARNVKMPLRFATREQWAEAEHRNPRSFWSYLYYNANIPIEERWMFKLFNAFSAVAIVLYFIGIFNLHMALNMGPFTIALQAIGVLVGFLGMISVVSIISRINLHILLFIAIFVLGRIQEPHYVRLSQSTNSKDLPFRHRPAFGEYFNRWTALRKDSIESKTTYPVYFVLADGGASRSGYWTANVLSRLEDQTNGYFSDHLLCLSGASGGSVGNGTFLALLMHQQELPHRTDRLEMAAHHFLKTDFLSFALARMLGPDIYKPLVPLAMRQLDDRAGALENAMENGAPNSAFLNHKLEDNFSQYIPNLRATHMLPVICINTTRMQDGQPAVVSNVLLNSSYSQRVDVLNLLDSGKDMRLSTAVVLGARFPYISPAGRIGNQYFVDGGYFDNSGAGVVHEMLLQLEDMMHDTLKANPNHYWSHLRFYVVHTQNSPYGTIPMKPVDPMVNDLAAPIKTMLGAYGTQTDVNNNRLTKYLEQLYQDQPTHYIPINLYRHHDSLTFPMNWSISHYMLLRINERLYSDTLLQQLIHTMNTP